MFISNHKLSKFLKLIFNYLEMLSGKETFTEIYLKPTGIFHVLLKL